MQCCLSSSKKCSHITQPSDHLQSSDTFIDVHINLQHILFKVVLRRQFDSLLFLVAGVQARWNTENDASCILLLQASQPSAYAISVQGVMSAAGDVESCVGLQQGINGLGIPG